ncbi:hypothetical protein N806_28755 [Rhodococcus sp. P27]|nr:hypothetical protein N601_07050 [Rhodococcus erythropolis DN1]ERB55117.1 hypothetical protein N806_28755 [Rhodococcus sp. P27]
MIAVALDLYESVDFQSVETARRTFDMHICRSAFFAVSAHAPWFRSIRTNGVH